MEPSKKISKSQARRISMQTLTERDREWKRLLDEGHAFELNEDCIRAHVLSMLGMLGEVEDLSPVLQARVVWEEMQESANGQVHPNVAEARKRVELLKMKVENSEDDTNLSMEKDDGVAS
jgi:hypothetical protein